MQTGYQVLHQLHSLGEINLSVLQSLPPAAVKQEGSSFCLHIQVSLSISLFLNLCVYMSVCVCVRTSVIEHLKSQG